jgi:RNA polymerase sigma factor (sigma-70 family)
LSGATAFAYPLARFEARSVADSDRPETSPGRWGEMMSAAQTGDARVYEELLGELVVWLRGYYRRRLPPGTVDDVVQDVLMAVHEKRATYDPNRPFGPWLAAIARYKWIDRVRSMGAEGTDPLDDNYGIPDHGEAVVAGSVFKQLLEMLKPAQAAVIRLVKIEGYSIEEASKATGQSEALVKINIHRGLKRLASIVQGNSDAD